MPRHSLAWLCCSTFAGLLLLLVANESPAVQVAEQRGCVAGERTKLSCVFEEGIDYPGGICNEKICTGSDLEFIKNVATPKR